MSGFIGAVPIGAVIVAILFGSAMLAMTIARLLPEHHLGPETKGVVSTSIAVVGTLSALVVSLLISSSSAYYRDNVQTVTQMSADLITLDRLLRRYGPEAEDIRVQLRGYAAAEVQDLSPQDVGQAAALENTATIALLEGVQDRLLALAPAGAPQQWLRTQALQMTAAMLTARWRFGQETAGSPPRQLLALVIFWFIVIFASFGLFAPRNVTAIVTILLSSIAVGGAIRMTTELQKPFGGLVSISTAPLSQALATISR